jgi:flagellar P-ring protein precursor FlgI
MLLIIAVRGSYDWIFGRLTDFVEAGIMKKILVLLVAFLSVISVSAQQEVRIKDVASLAGLEDIQLYGYGLVVGLAGTGDRTQTVFTEQTIGNMLKNMGIELPERQIRIRNVAAVMVTGYLKPFKKHGTRLDVSVSSLGDATSLEGGTLILTPLQGPDGTLYASAQGALATGGYDASNSGSGRFKKNHVMVARIPDGAIVQKEFRFNVLDQRDISLSLTIPDFTSAIEMAKSINQGLLPDSTMAPVAIATDASTVKLNYEAYIKTASAIRPNNSVISLVEFISFIENLSFQVANSARVVVNERTGTIVAGGDVRISEVAVTHGSVKIEIVNIPEVVQPQPYSLGQTTVITNPQMVVDEKDAEMIVLPSTSNVSDLAQSLNSLGVTPRDIIAILQAIKEAGALQAQLVIM